MTSRDRLLVPLCFALLGGLAIARLGVRGVAHAGAVVVLGTSGTRDTTEIRLNQIGFLPASPKVAVVVNPTMARFAVLRAGDGDTVLAGELLPAGEWPPSAETVRVADFSSLTSGGRYVIAANGSRSAAFAIGGDVLRDVARAAVKAFYYQRASVELPARYAGEWARAAGHPDRDVLIHASAAGAGRPSGARIASPGGWYDAGDYNKYIVNSGISTYTLLTLAEHFPSNAASLTTGIPESGNALPDVLDEALWNLRWMLTMQDPSDGGVYHKLTTADFDAFELPDHDRAPRYVVQKSTAATLDAAAVMAHASVVVRAYSRVLPALSDSLTTAALRAWAWARKHPDSTYDQARLNAQTSPRIATGEYGDRKLDDEFRWAAAELYLATRLDSFLVVASPIAEGYDVPSWSSVRTLGLYSLVDHRRELPRSWDTTALKQRLFAIADSLVATQRRSAYRVPIGAPGDWVWGSNGVAANQGMLLVQAYRASGTMQYLDAAAASLDYLLGRNATGYSFVTGMGARTPMHPHHRPSESDGIAAPVPGLLVGGPNPGRQDRCAGYPSVLPARAYVDDVCSYASNEVAINWNAPFAYLVGALDALGAARGGPAGSR
jgi:endoglucanase